MDNSNKIDEENDNKTNNLRDSSILMEDLEK